MAELTQLGRYQIQAPLGSGAYANVYRALDTALNRTVALKVLKPALLVDEEAFQRFVQEAQVASTLFHPHIATVLDIGQAQGYHFLAMRLVNGLSLDKVLQQRGALPWVEALRIVEQVASALGFAHGQGLVHRDVKPQNILISPQEGAVLTDFGLVKAIQTQKLTATGIVVGTPQYIAPEIWRGEEALPASDQYALACVLVEMLTNRALYYAPTPPAVMLMHFQPAPLPDAWPQGTPAGLSQVLQKALAIVPGQRYSQLGEFVLSLRQPSHRVSPAAQAVKPPASTPAVPTETATPASSLKLAVITPENASQIRFLESLTGHSGSINAVVFSPGGSLMATGSQDGTVKLWQTQSRQLWTTLGIRSGAVLSLAFSADGSRLAAGVSDHTVRVFRLQKDTISAEVLTGVPGQVTSVSYSPAGQLAAATTDGNGGGVVWGKWGAKKMVDDLKWVAFSQSGRSVLAGEHYYSGIYFYEVLDSFITIDVRCKEEVSGGSGSRYFAFSPKGDLLAFQSSDQIYLISVGNRQAIGNFPSGQGNVTGLAFSKTGILVSGGAEKSVKLWRVSDRKCIHNLADNLLDGPNNPEAGAKKQPPKASAQIDYVHGLAFSPDGTLLACGMDDGSLLLWGVPA